MDSRIEYRSEPNGGWNLYINNEWKGYSIKKEYLEHKAARITAGVAATAGGEASGFPAADQKAEPHTTEQILSALSSGTHMSEAMREQVAEIVRGSAWKDIASAPKDETPILLSRRNYNRTTGNLNPPETIIGKWHQFLPDVQGEWYADCPAGVSGIGQISSITIRDMWHGIGPFKDVGPTHWQHLPAPPDSTT